MTVDVTDAADWRRSAEAAGLLKIFNDAGAIEAADVLVAQRLTALGNEPDERVALAVAFVVRAVRGGSVCLELTALQAQVEIDDLPWPAPEEWGGGGGGPPPRE